MFMLNENSSTIDYSKKCESVKEYFLQDENFKNTKNNINKINKNFKDIFSSFCNFYQENEIIIDYRYFKLLEQINGLDKDFIIEYLVKTIQTVLQKKDKFFIHVCLQSLSISDIEKQYKFICKLSETLNNVIPDISDKLEKCFLYKAPFMLSQLISILSTCVNKKTLSNIQVVK